MLGGKSEGRNDHAGQGRGYFTLQGRRTGGAPGTAPGEKPVETGGYKAMLARYRCLDLCDEKCVFAGRMLGDMGADVIKMERPGGDTLRGKGPFLDTFF